MKPALAKESMHAAMERRELQHTFRTKGKYTMYQSLPWKDGNHQVLHRDGVGLTDAMEPVPHGLDVLEKAQAIRPLHAKEPRSEHWCSWCAFSSGINLRIQISIHP